MCYSLIPLLFVRVGFYLVAALKILLLSCVFNVEISVVYGHGSQHPNHSTESHTSMHSRGEIYKQLTPD